MWTFFSFAMVGICISIFFLIRRYADKNVEWVVRVATAYAWFTSMCVVALVPLDVWFTLTGLSSPVLGWFWSFAYWSTQAATWLVLPFYQVYAEAGDFTIKARAWTSIKENIILYASVGALGAVGIVILLAMHKMTITDMMGLGIGLSNAFALTAGLVLLGYGLVEIPRQMWKNADPEIMHKWAAHRVGKNAEEAMKQRAELEDVITVIYANQRQMRRHDPLRKYMDIVVDYAERESPVKPSDLASRTVDIEHLRAEDLEYNYDKDGLAALRRRLFWAVANYKGARAKYEGAVVEALQMERIMKARALREYATPTDIPGVKLSAIDKSTWGYRVALRPYANKVYAVILAVTSVCIVWGEITIPIQSVDMSPFSLLVKSIKSGAEFPIQLFTVLPLVYICACMYYTLFRLTLFGYNKLVPTATTGPALMQNGSLMCRFSAATCWNYYHIIRMSDNDCVDCAKTVFSVKMASMDVLPLQHLNTYLPVILGVMCLITLGNFWDSILNCCTSSRYRFSLTENVADIYTEKGCLLVRKEADAMSKGFALGEVLPTAYVELEFPPITTAAAKGKQKGLFSRMFGKKVLQPETNGASSSAPSVTAPPTKHYTSSAAQAASRWLPGGSKEPDASSTTFGSSAPAPANAFNGSYAAYPGAIGAPLAGSEAPTAGYSGPGALTTEAYKAPLEVGTAGKTGGAGGLFGGVLNNAGGLLRGLGGQSQVQQESAHTSLLGGMAQSNAPAARGAAATSDSGAASGLDSIFAGLSDGGAGRGRGAATGGAASALPQPTTRLHIDSQPAAGDNLFGKWGIR